MARTPDETKKPARKPTAKAAPAPVAKAAPVKASARKPAAAPKAKAAPVSKAKAPPARKPTTAKAAAARKPAVAKAAPARKAPARGAEAPAPAKAKPRATTATVRAAPKAKPAAAPKRTAPKRARAPKADPDRLERLVEAARKSLDDDKAVDIVVLDVTNRASYADRLIIATGLVGRQIEAMATHVDDALAKEGMHLRRSAFSKSEEWVLIDAGDLVIHLFTPEARLKFDLEKMWGPDSPMGEAAPGEQSPI